MRITVVAAGTLPNPDSGGSPITLYALLEYLAGTGRDVALCAIQTTELGVPIAEGVAALEALGISVTLVESHGAELAATRETPLRAMALSPPDEQLFPMLLDAPAVRDAVAEQRPDVTFVYHWGALAAASTLREVTPRLAVGVDLPHLPAVQRFRSEPKRLDKPTVARVLMLQAQIRKQPRLLARLLRDCEASGDYAAHHAAWLARHGVPGCRYFRMPVPDFGGAGWQAVRDAADPGRRPSILMLGRPGGTSTQAGLQQLGGLLPHLDAALGRDGYRLDVIGGTTTPAGLEEVFAHPAVQRHGYVPDLGDWMQRADVVLVPTPIKVGVRVRILTAFTFGACIVAHRANASGIPELVSGQNCLLGRNPRELAAQTVRALQDRSLRERLGTAGRATYEANFEPAVAGKPILETLERIARRN